MKMMRTVLRTTFLAAVLPLAAASCGADDPGAANRVLAEGPGEFELDFRDNAAYFTQMDGPQDGRSPHGLVQIWYSENIRELLAEDEFVVPLGTVSLKTGDPDKDGEINAITVMIKRSPGFDPDNGDWEYQMRNPQGGIVQNDEGDLVQGAVEMCIDCHGASSRTDFLAGTRIR